MPTYLVHTRDFGTLRKADDTIRDARQWARVAFPQDRTITVQRERQEKPAAVPTGSLLRKFGGP